jgi:hypothetical protein
MARRSFDVIDIVEILVHWYAGRSKNEMAASLGIDRKTIRKYLGPVEAAGITPGGPPVSDAEWAQRVREWFPELADTRLRQVTWPQIAAHHEFIAEQLKAGVTQATIHQRLVDERGLAASYASLRRYVAANMGEEVRRSQVTVLNPHPARLVPDNLKTGVDRPDLYDPKINRSYAELAAHYGVLADPARARKPKDKAQVERPMPYIRDSFWRTRAAEFTSIEQMQAEAVRWCTEVAGQRACRPLDGAKPAMVFAAVEAQTLAPLPRSPFTLATWAKAKVGPDIHARVDGVLYSIPWQHIGKSVDARSTFTMVQFFIGGELVKTHPRKQRGKQTDLGDYPPEKIAFFMRGPAWCRKKAAEIGPACTELIAGLLAENALYRLRAAQGVLGLADKHNPARLEAACAKATGVGDPTYKTVKGILAAGTEGPPVHEPTGDAGAAAFTDPISCSATSSPCPPRTPMTRRPR